jgi:hypothetical protein
MKLLATVLSSCALVACGGGSSAPSVTQAEATNIVNSVDSAQVILGDALPVYFQLQNIFYALPSTLNASQVPTVQVSTVSCSQSGSYTQTYTKGSAGVGYANTGDTISIVYSACNNGTSTLNGTLSAAETIIGGGIVRAQLQATNFTEASGGLSVAFSGSFAADSTATSNNNIASLTWKISGVGPLTGTLAGFPAPYKNGSYTLNNFSYTNATPDITLATGTRAYTLTVPYVGTDNANYTLSLATTTPVTLDYAATTTDPITKPGLFAISGFLQSSVQVTNDSSSSSTVKVSNGANGTTDLTFKLSGSYFF